jgi:hypothetical protein
MPRYGCRAGAWARHQLQITLICPAFRCCDTAACWLPAVHAHKLAWHDVCTECAHVGLRARADSALAQATASCALSGKHMLCDAAWQVRLVSFAVAVPHAWQCACRLSCRGLACTCALQDAVSALQLLQQGPGAEETGIMWCCTPTARVLPLLFEREVETATAVGKWLRRMARWRDGPWFHKCRGVNCNAMGHKPEWFV